MAQKLSEIWVQVVQHIAASSFEEAASLVEELRASSKRRGRAFAAAAEVASALLALQDKDGRNSVVDLAKALSAAEASWSDAAVLLLSHTAPGASPWDELWPKAQRVAKGRSLKLDQAKASGVLWSPDLRPAALGLGASSPPEAEEPDLGTAGSEEQRATLLVRSALSAAVSPVDASKDAKEALSLFRDLNLPEGEATALLAVSRTSLDADIAGAQSAANQALKLFRDLGHLKGLAAATHAAAVADKARQNSDDAVFKANEGLKLADQIGDRGLEFALCETIVEANVVQGKGGYAVEAAQEAQQLGASLSEKALKAKARVLLAKAYGAYEERMGAGIKAAKEALELFTELESPKGMLEALRGLAAASKGDYSEVVSTAQKLAETFSRASRKEEEAQSLLVAVSCLRDSADEALHLAQGAHNAARAASRQTQAHALRALAQIHLQKEEPAEGMRDAMKAANIFRSEPFQTREIRDAEIHCVEMQIQANAKLGRFDEAFNTGLEHGRRFKGLRERRGEGCVLMQLVELHRKRLETKKALQVLQFIPALFSQAGDRTLEGLAWEQIARIHLEKGEVLLAQKAVDEAALNFRKQGSRLHRGRAALLLADVQVGLMGLDKGNPVVLLESAQEAAELLKGLAAQETEHASALQLLANAQLMNWKTEAALASAREAQEVAQRQKRPAAQAAALLLESGAALQKQDFEESMQCAKNAKELFSSDMDEMGESSANEFISYIKNASGKAQSGEEDFLLFRGFGLRHISPEAVQEKAEAQQAARQPRRQQARQQDVYLFQCEAPSKMNDNGRCIMTYFEGFEHRAGVERQQQTKLKTTKEEEAASATDYSKTFKESVKHGYPEKEPAVFAVRWVQATDAKKEQPGARSKRAEYVREEDSRVVSVASLGAPSAACARYARSERLEAPGERHGYKVH